MFCTQLLLKFGNRLGQCFRCPILCVRRRHCLRKVLEHKNKEETKYEKVHWKLIDCKTIQTVLKRSVHCCIPRYIMGGTILAPLGLVATETSAVHAAYRWRRCLPYKCLCVSVYYLHYWFLMSRCLVCSQQGLFKCRLTTLAHPSIQRSCIVTWRSVQAWNPKKGTGGPKR